MSSIVQGDIDRWSVDPNAATLTIEHPGVRSAGAHDYKVNFPVLFDAAVRAPKIVNGNGVRLWTDQSDRWEWIGSDGPGPSDSEHVVWRDLHLRSQGVLLYNANFARIDGLTVAHADTAFEALNRNADGQGEHNRLSARIMNCVKGVVLGGGSGSPSHRGWDMHAVITGTDKPFTVGPLANVYGGKFRLQISVKESSSAAAVCLDGSIHGAEFDVLVENVCDVGIALGDKRTWDMSTQTQGYIRAHFVHAVQYPGVFDGPMADLPPYRFTYGNPANGNHLRPAWVCADGDVYEHYKLP